MTDKGARIWDDLATLAQQGDQRAYSQLLGEIGIFAKNYLGGRVSDIDAVEDITQEVLISVHKSLHTYAPDRPFKPWLISIINFRRADYLRRHYARKADKTVSADILEFKKDFVTNPEYSGEYKDVETFLDGLPGRQREVFRKLKIEGYTAQEVAGQMKMSVSAVKVSAHRTLEKLKDKLEYK